MEMFINTLNEASKTASMNSEYKIGKTYQFYIESEEKTADGRGYFNLFDKRTNTCHVYYFNDSHEASPGTYIYLTVSEIGPNGELGLAAPEAAFSEADLCSVKQVESKILERESQHLELKSSMVYTQKGMINVDKQLGCEIIHAVAGMLNADGGEIKIGYRYNGVACGINKDLPYINFSTTDSARYSASFDGVELKIRHEIMTHLGCYASSLVDIEFGKTAENLAVVFLKVKKASMPVFVREKFLYVRMGNTTVNLAGSDITTYICERCKVAAAVDLPTPEPEVETVADNVKGEVVSGEGFAEENATFMEAVRYITLYKNGGVSTQEYPVESSTVLFDIPLKASEISDPDTRLAIAYENGHVAFFKPHDILAEKLHAEGEYYKNGWNTQSKIVNVLLCNAHDYLVVRSKLILDGTAMVKAVAVDKYRTYHGNSMHAQGHKIVDEKMAKAVEYVAVKDHKSVEKIFYKAGYTPGYPEAKERCSEVVALLNCKAA